MKVDLEQLKSHIGREVQVLERRITALKDQIRQIEAVQQIAEKIDQSAGRKSASEAEGEAAEVEAPRVVRQEDFRPQPQESEPEEIDQGFDWAFKN